MATMRALGDRQSGRRRLAAALALIAFTTLCAGADATSEAQKRFDEGKVLYRRAHDVEGARLKFAQAYALQPRPEVLWNLAVCELEAGLAEDASMHLKAYARTPDARPALVAKVPELLASARSRLGALLVEAPARARVQVDGRAIDRLDWQAGAIDLTPGDRVLVIEVGSERVEDIVTITQGATTVRRVDDREAPARDASAPAPRDVERIASPLAPLAPAAEPARVAMTTAVVAYTTAVLGLGALGAGVGFALASRADARDADAARSQLGAVDCRTTASSTCVQLTDALDAGNTNAGLSVGFYAASAALLGASTWLFYDAYDTRRLRALWTPSGVLLRGDF